MKRLITYQEKWYHAIPVRDPKLDDRLLVFIFVTLAVVNIVTLLLPFILTTLT